MGGMAGRPRTFDRDAALDLALTAFWDRGYDRVTIAELANAIGIGPPSLYAAFGDKKSLFAEASARYEKRLSASLAQDLSAPRALDAVAAVLFSAAAAFAAEDTPPGCLVMAEPLLAERRAQTRQLMLERLEHGAADGELAHTDVAALADFVDTVLAGMAARARDGAGRHQLENAARLALLTLAALTGTARGPVGHAT
jgi:AcrR family transcriptional regulator